MKEKIRISIVAMFHRFSEFLGIVLQLVRLLPIIMDLIDEKCAFQILKMTKKLKNPTTYIN